MGPDGAATRHSSIHWPLPLCVLGQPLATVSVHRHRGEGAFRFNSTTPADSFWGSTGITDQSEACPCVPGAHAAPAPVTRQDDHPAQEAPTKGRGTATLPSFGMANLPRHRAPQECLQPAQLQHSGH